MLGLCFVLLSSRFSNVAIALLIMDWLEVIVVIILIFF